MRIVYEITVKNWEKYNPSKKKGYTKFLMSARFFDDDKIATSTSLERLLYVTILARCCDERAATTRTTRDQYLTMLGQRRYDIATALIHLEEKQLLIWQNRLPNRIEEKKKTKKRKNEHKLQTSFACLENESNQEQKEPEFFKEKIRYKKSFDNSPEINREVWEAYYNARKKRYPKEEPTRDSEINRKIKKLVGIVGKDVSIKLIEFYLSHPNAYYARESHPLGLLVAKYDSFNSEMQREVQITGSQVKELEKAIEQKEQQDYFERKWGNDIK